MKSLRVATAVTVMVLHVQVLSAQTFSNAPVLNPDRSRGIRLYIDAGIGDGGELIPDYGLFDFCPAVNYDQVNYCDVRSEYFSLERMGIFHSCVFAIGMPEGRSGRAEGWGSDLIVSVQDLADGRILDTPKVDPNAYPIVHARFAL